MVIRIKSLVSHNNKWLKIITYKLCFVICRCCKSQWTDILIFVLFTPNICSNGRLIFAWYFVWGIFLRTLLLLSYIITIINEIIIILNPYKLNYIILICLTYILNVSTTDRIPKSAFDKNINDSFLWILTFAVIRWDFEHIISINRIIMIH